MKLRVLSILMWKHAVVRIRRFIHTALDIVSPLMFLILLFALKDNIRSSKPETEERDPVANTEIIPLVAEIIPQPYRIMYYPETMLTDSLMGDVGVKLNLKRLNATSGHSEKGYFPLSNLSRLPDFATNMKIMEAIIIFQDMSGETWPTHLNYTIRMKTNFKTGTYRSLDDTPGPHRMFGFKYGTFMRIQWAVDTSYIKLLTGDEIPQTLSLQEFPYYYRRLSEVTVLICKSLSVLCWLSLLLTFVFLMGRLLQERASGIQELMKMVGVPSKLIALSHLLNVLPIMLVFSIVGTILLKATSYPLIPHSSGVVIFLMLLLYIHTVVAMAFACSYIASGTSYAASLSVMAYIALWIPARMATRYNLPAFATGFLPHMPMFWFWTEVSTLEIYGTGSNFSNISTTHAFNNGSVLLCYIFMLLQAIIFYFAAWYLSHVRPGQYGQPLPWNFLFKWKPKPNETKNIVKEQSGDYEISEYGSSVLSTVRTVTYELRKVTQGIGRLNDYSTRFYSSEADDPSYWSKNEVQPQSEDDEEEHPMTSDQRFFESAPENAEPGIKVVNVSKVYPQHRALRNVSLEVYKGEITVLLGHNGAGKTTLMSIITGMTSATEGNVYVNGKDTVTEQSEVRKHLGLCPQYNLFFEDLTVQQHIMFFTLLKQGTFAEARVSARTLAERLSISEKLNSLPYQLSGGMKRRVQLACALTGGADVLVLDEPTSGLDVETRRELWDLLLSLRGERTVLLTTHFMEEADALGDRVAALHAGVLRCFATTMHLKRAVGSGYRLVLTTIGAPKEEAITKVVTAQVHDAAIKEQTIYSISYSLPAARSGQFPRLFAALEAQRSKLGIDSIGVGVSTLEEVFLKLCSDIDTTLTEDEVDNAREPEVPPKKLTGAPLYLRQLLVLWKRQVKYAIHKKWVFLILQILIPITMIMFMTYSLNGREPEPEPEEDRLAMNLDMYEDRDRRVMYHLDSPVIRSQDVETVRKRYPGVAFEDADDVATAILRTGKKDILEYNKYLVGVEINETDAKILYTTLVRHAAPVALNLLSNLLAAQRMPWADGRTVTTHNDPLGRELRQSGPVAHTQPKHIVGTMMWGLFIAVIILSTNVNTVSLPCKERQTNSRHIHVMSGCPAELHWLATLSFQFALCALTLVLPTVLAVLLLEEDETTNQPDTLATFTLILLLGSLSFFAFGYLVGFNFGERATSTILVACIFIFGVFTTSTQQARNLDNEEQAGVVHALLLLCRYVAPPHTMTQAALQCLDAARANALCKLLRPRCPALVSLPGLEADKCCAGQNPQCYLCLDDKAPGENIIILIGQFFFMMAMVFLTERGIFNGLFDKLMNINYRPKEPLEQDEMVRAEKAYVSKAITLPAKQIPDAMLVHDLHKNYKSFFRKNVNAVRGVNFSVKKGECFGLLGVNGAGKSTTFKMMTAEETATRGNIFGNGYHLKRGNSQYLQTLGYCPQFFGLDMFLTGQENLALILTLRGFDKQRVEEEVKNWIQIVGLEKYAQRAVDGYSGGCVRRLGAAAALCGGAELALLDEPSAGVDVAARRRLWTALRRALRQRRAIVITSHSMDEMEALCSRIAILAGGRVRALGTAAGLRAAHARGHAVVLKLASAQRAGADEVDGAKTQMNELKGKLQTTFNCTLKDEHRTMLHYHINETMRYSELFTSLESLRTAFPSLIEDYSVTETTLEEVFLSFAKEQQAGAQNV